MQPVKRLKMGLVEGSGILIPFEEEAQADQSGQGDQNDPWALEKPKTNANPRSEEINFINRIRDKFWFIPFKGAQL